MNSKSETAGRTHLVDHVNLKREVLFIDAMFARGVHMELLEGKVFSFKSSRASHDGLQSGAQVLTNKVSAY